MKVLLWLAGSFDRRNPTEHLLIAMMENLCKLGHSVHVLQKDTKGPGPELPEELVRLGITTTRIPCAMNGVTKFVYRYLAEIRYALECSKWISHHREFDRVFVQSSNVAGIQVFFAKYMYSKSTLLANYVSKLWQDKVHCAGKDCADIFCIDKNNV